MSALRWLLVGAGDIARKRVAPALAQADGSALAALCSRHPDTARALAQRVGGIPVFTDLETALASASIDAVYLATPVFRHVPEALRALAAGKHVLVEKPLGLDAAECAPLLDAAAKSDRTTGCAYYRRFSARYRHAQETIARGALGEIVGGRVVCESRYDPAPDDPKHWRVEKAKAGGGPLCDVGCHMLDLAAGLLGAPTRVFARCETRAHDWEVEDSATALVTFADAIPVTASFSWATDSWAHALELIGTDGRLVWNPFDSGLVTLVRGRETQTFDLPPAENVHLPLVQDFVDAVRGARPPGVPLAEAVRTTALIDAFYRSSAEGREVPAG